MLRRRRRLFVPELFFIIVVFVESAVYGIALFFPSTSETLKQQRNNHVQKISLLPRWWSTHSASSSCCTYSSLLTLRALSLAGSKNSHDGDSQPLPLQQRLDQNQNPSANPNQSPRSFVRSIRSHNLAGLFNLHPQSQEERSIAIDLTSTTTVPTAAVTTATDQDEEKNMNNNNSNSMNENLVVVTGETGAGKSILFRKALELLCGAKVTSSLFKSRSNHNNDNNEEDVEEEEEEEMMVVEMEVVLHEPHLSFTQSALENLGVNPLISLSSSLSSLSPGLLRIQRKMQRLSMSTSPFSSSNRPHQRRRRIKNVCTINDQTVTLATLERIVSPLVAIVDATVAATALATTSSTSTTTSLSSSRPRVAMLDTGVVHLETLRVAVRQAQESYRRCRRTREQLERVLSERILPVHISPLSDSGSGVSWARDDKDTALLQHWVNELDIFETRVTKMCSEIGTSASTVDDLDDAGCTLNSLDMDVFFPMSFGRASSLIILARQVGSLSWMDNLHHPSPKRWSAGRETKSQFTEMQVDPLPSSLSSDQRFSSALFHGLTNLRDSIVHLEQHLANAQTARELMGSLGSRQSAVTAVERTRSLLIESSSYTSGVSAALSTSTNSGAGSNRISRASEKAHDLLIRIEESIQDFCDCLEEESNGGLIGAIESELKACSTVSKDDIDSLLLEWSTLARKHGIASSLLPSCHEALQAELNGNVEALNRLPAVLAQERKSLEEFQEACSKLSHERRLVADQLSLRVTSLLPQLGLGHLVFDVVVQTDTSKCTNSGVYNAPSNRSMVGVDEVYFRLLPKDNRNVQYSSSLPEESFGSVHTMTASSGEKARLLLAIECALPSSVGAACCALSGDSIASTTSHNDVTAPGPVMVLYDEIDAHVGGHAAVSLAGMLVHQSESCQVIAITHNPSVAASGDVHLVVRRERTHILHQDIRSNTRLPLFVVAIDKLIGSERRKELARMASGDLAATEAEIFADALIRDGSKRRTAKMHYH